MGRGELLRRGMSPLIATVLLMAFAVALGGMIMNWSVDETQDGDCELINVRVTQFCAQDDKVLIFIRNDPASVELRGIKLNVVESSIESTLTIKDSGLQPGQPLELGIPVASTPNTRIDILGVVGSIANPITCTQPIATANPIKNC